ncbi:hypothetical protein GJU39_21625 [Pedobacter petrophilus]|uniref:PRC-barrel domain-containing protein n=1 Tax=Pedobacter petrophilus TaxID=1908241 RepID=A0A7K0G4F3_9SPHI|nr:PRC-barrel domain-containing protein [Pedobacter petrophilus]MRX78683.1 hypothetical protein [Pedobacter petrophilus]
MNAGNIEYINLEELSNTDYKITDGEADITGWPVIDESGSPVGKVRDLLFDPQQNAIRYIIVDLNNTIAGIEEKAVLIPIGFANLGDEKKAVVLPVMHESQFIAMPQYIIGEVTRDTEVKIRSAIGSPAALVIEEEIADLEQGDFYRHHHFDRGNILSADREFRGIQDQPEAVSASREEEAETIHQLIDHSEAKRTTDQESPQNTAGSLEEFSVNTSDGTFGIAPQENGTYRILQGENKIGVIYAEAGEQGVRWRTMDQMGDRFVMMIGEAITAHNLSASDI